MSLFHKETTFGENEILSTAVIATNYCCGSFDWIEFLLSDRLTWIYRQTCKRATLASGVHVGFGFQDSFQKSGSLKLGRGAEGGWRVSLASWLWLRQEVQLGKQNNLKQTHGNQFAVVDFDLLQVSRKGGQKYSYWLCWVSAAKKVRKKKIWIYLISRTRNIQFDNKVHTRYKT